MDFETVWRSAAMVIGIGLVIFVHEFGHFLAARLCKVRVDVFSLGFGLKLIGFKRGDTLYQIAAVPIGGYCRMAGEEQVGDDTKPQPYELRAKSVGQRFFIYSGGVLMNVLFGVVVMPLILFHGVPFNEPVIGSVDPGSGAWHAELEPGTRVLTVNGNTVAGFEYIAHEVALGPPDEARLEVVPPGETAPRTVVVRPRYDEVLGFQTIGVDPGTDHSGEIEVAEGSAAAKAGLKTGDRVVGIDGPLPELTLQEQIQIVSSRNGSLHLRVVRGSEPERTVVVTPVVSEESKQRRLGIKPAFDIVADLRTNADVVSLGLARGDRIVHVNGKRIFHSGDFALALLESEGGSTTFEIDRDGQRITASIPALDRARAIALANDVAIGDNSAQREIALLPNTPAVAAGLLDGDKLLLVDGAPIKDWKAFVDLSIEAANAKRPLSLSIEREEASGALGRHEINVTAGPVVEDYGLDFRMAMYTYHADSFGEALRVGSQATWKFLTDAWTMIKRMLLGHVSGKNMGGIITIGVVSYSWAGAGIAKLLFFLCMLSLQLAFINVLPVPLLDGGHLFFLAIEKLKGSPVSERVFGYSQMVGLVLILSLVVYVTYNDLVRWKIFGL